MDGAAEYRDAWRGLRILVPAGWQVRRSGAGIFLHDGAGRQAVLVQPRPGARSIEQLAEDLLAWLRRIDPQARLVAEPGGATPARFYTATALLSPGEEAAGAFALQAGPHGGLISGFLAPAVGHEGARPAALGALASLAAAPLLARQRWCEPSERACTALVPEGWQAEGMLRRAAGGPPAVEFRAWSADGMEAIGSVTGKVFVEPGLLSGLLGRLTGGLVRAGRFVDAAAYAEAHLLPALRQEAPGARLDAVIPRPDLIPARVAQDAEASGLGVAGALQGQPSAADVRFAFERGGQSFCRVSRVFTMRAPATLAQGLPVWVALTPLTYQAPASSLAEWEPVLEGVCLSLAMEPAWKDRQQALIAAQVGLSAPPRQPGECAPTLGEVEHEFCAQSGLRLAIHERPFPAPEAAEHTEELAALYDAGVWRGRG